MNHYSVHDTLYEENGNFRLTKEECGILLKKKKSSVVYCPKEDERRPGAMYPRCICLAHNGEKNGTLLATFECYSQCILPLHGGKQVLNLCPRQISGELALIEAAVADVYVKA